MIFNFGSINLDLVYRLPHLPAAGETLASTSFEKFLGGKGINQSIAVAQSGGAIRHVGCLGPDGHWLRDEIAGYGLSTADIAEVKEPTGHAVIYVDDAAENQIVLFGGSNLAFSTSQIEHALEAAEPGDWVLLQNETNLVAHIAQLASDRGLKVAYSAAPFDAQAVEEVLEHLTLLALNEGEADALSRATGRDVSDLGIDHVLITKGAQGATLTVEGQTYHQESFAVNAVDTTGAGDTFLGAFMARFEWGGAQEALRFAAASAAIQVTRQGAAAAIPTADDVEAFLHKL